MRRAAGGAVAILQLGRPDGSGAGSFDPEALRLLRSAWDEALADESVRAIVLTGAGRSFSAGADVAAFESGLRDGTAPAWVLEATGLLHPLLLEMQGSGKPVVAAVNGAAAGGGLGLALAADVRIASPEARFAASYFRMGLSPDGGATWLMPRLIGMQRTRRFFFTNEVMDSSTALSCGLVDEVVSAQALLERAVEVAALWGAWASSSREATKRLLLQTSVNGFASHLELERGLIAAAAATPDFAEGVAAFRAKRAPRF